MAPQNLRNKRRHSYTNCVFIGL